VVGQADLLLMPELNAGKMLIFQLRGRWRLHPPGARVQIVLTSRSDSPPSRVASSKLAQRGSGAER
jgi:phosphotransacetylase